MGVLAAAEPARRRRTRTVAPGVESLEGVDSEPEIVAGGGRTIRRVRLAVWVESPYHGLG